MSNQSTFTAQDLVRRFVAMHVLIPDFKRWSQEALKDLPHPLRKFQELHALLAAFDIGCEPAWFVKGGAIRLTVAEADAFIAGVYEANPNRGAPEWDFEIPFADAPEPTDLTPREDIRRYFAELYRFRHRAEQFLTDGRTIYEADPLTLCAMDDVQRWMGAVDSVLRGSGILKQVDDTLATMLDPKGRVFTLEELETRFGFPPPKTPSDDDDDFF